MFNKLRIFHLLPFLIGGIACMSEVLHTIHENPQHQCHILADIVDDNLYELYNEFLRCELKHSSKCSPYSEVLDELSYECKTFAKSLFFNKEFDAIAYAYSQQKDELMSFLIDNISVFSLDDPDFLNYFIFNEFFNARIYEKILYTLAKSRKSIIDPHTQILQLLEQQLIYKAQSEVSKEKQYQVVEALRLTKCEFLKQQVNLYYVLAFSMNGKFQFDNFFQQMVGVNKTTDVMDHFIQFMSNNAFVFVGADEMKMEGELDQQELKTIQPRISIISLEEEKLPKLAHGIRETLMDEELKERINEEALTKKFLQAFDFTTINIFPIYFGSDKFNGFRSILQQLGSNQCGLLEVQRFKERVKKYIVFMDEGQKKALIKMISEFLEQTNINDNQKNEDDTQNVKIEL